jgi:hypothetical protein
MDTRGTTLQERRTREMRGKCNMFRSKKRRIERVKGKK